MSFQLSLAVVLNLDLKVFLATLNGFSLIFEIQSKFFVSSALAGVNHPSFLLQVKVSLVKCTLVSIWTQESSWLLNRYVVLEEDNATFLIIQGKRRS